MMKNHYKIVLSQQNPLDYAEFERLRATEGLPGLPMYEWAQKVECFQNARAKYPDMAPLDAYLALISAQGGMLVKPPERPKPDETRPCGGCGQDNLPTSASILDLVLNAGLAISKYVQAGMKNVSSEVRNKRLAICQSVCPSFTGERCKTCGCFVRIKSWMGTEDCPEGKWAKDEV